MKNELETVPCRLCGEPTYMKVTRLCDRCYELETWILQHSELVMKILLDRARWTWRKPRYSYKAYSNDKYFGKRLFHVQECSGGQFRVKEAILVKTEAGELGWIGEGVTWGLNFIVGEGSWSFNPVKEDRLQWSPYHHAFIFKSDEEHFQYPVIINEVYTLEEGNKYHVGAYFKKEVPRLPERKLM